MNKSLGHNSNRYIQCINSLLCVNKNFLKILNGTKNPPNVKIA